MTDELLPPGLTLNEPPPKRRGRPQGSKNKAKVASQPESGEAGAETEPNMETAVAVELGRENLRFPGDGHSDPRFPAAAASRSDPSESPAPASTSKRSTTDLASSRMHRPRPNPASDPFSQALAEVAAAVRRLEELEADPLAILVHTAPVAKRRIIEDILSL